MWYYDHVLTEQTKQKRAGRRSNEAIRINSWRQKILLTPASSHEHGEEEELMTDYKILAEQIMELAKEDPYYLPLLSNTSALIMETLPDLNWSGFYLVKDGRLVLGPFQGKVACIHIGIGDGVCGTAVKTDKVLRVEDVHKFPGHIACDSASSSEIVLPIHRTDASGNRGTAAVLDIDSPLTGRFSEDDEAGLAKIVKILEETIQW